MVTLTPEQAQAELLEKTQRLQALEKRMSSGVQQVRLSDGSGTTYQDADTQMKLAAELRAEIATLARIAGRAPQRIRQVYYTTRKAF